MVSTCSLTPFPLVPPFSNGTDILYSSRYHFRCVELGEDDANEISESLYYLFQSPLTNSITFSVVCVPHLSGKDWPAYSE